MTFIVGLGNPGSQYTHSRHNIGFQAVGRLETIVNDQRSTAQWEMDKSLSANILEVEGAVLVQPQTYMNLSGNAVKAVMKKYDYSSLGKKDFHNLFVIYDDLDIEVGKYKLIFGSGPKVHNGVNDIVQKLETDQFWHIRIGVDGRKGDRSEDPADYVLGGFRDEEQILIEKVVGSIVEILREKIAHT